MISDRISLNLAYIYLKKFQSNTGPISDILLRKTMHTNTISTLETRFTDLNSFKAWIDLNAPLSQFNDIDCLQLSIYELISFNVITPESNKNVVVNANRIFTTNSLNINKANLLLLNDSKKSYIKFFKEVLEAFTQLKLDEYILNQQTYIDCKYIQIYFGKYLDQLSVLYKEYKNRT